MIKILSVGILAAVLSHTSVAAGSLTVQDGVKSVFLKPTDFSPVK